MDSGQYEFGVYRLDAQGRVLFREGDHVALPPKVVELLVALVQAEGRALTREHLLQRLWPDTVVEEGSLTSHVSLLRKALGEGPQGQEFIETLPKRGYRFVASVKRVGSGAPDRGVDRAMLVVLPFENFTAGERYDYFSDGLTEEMITELARLSPERLGVIARTSAMQFKSTPKSTAQIGSELGVSHVLEGSVRRAGERVRITAQLIRVSDESHLWAESYERGLHDVLEVQAEVSRAVAREIQIKLTPHEKQRLDPDKARSVNPQAYELYLRGRHFWNRRTEEGIRRGIECFEEALRYDPGLAAAYDGISDAHTMLACRGMTPAVESFHKAKAAARQAVRMQPELGEGYASLAHVRLHDWDWVGLESEFRRAVELDPGYAIAHYWYAEYLMAMGRTREALGRVHHSLELDPLNSVINASVGMIHYLAHDYDGALAALRRGLEADPTHYVSHLRVGLVCLQKKLANEAVDAMRQAVLHSAGSTEALAGLAQAQAVAGDKSAMERIVRELGDSGRRYVSPYNVARVYGAIDDKQRALEWLEKAYQEHNPDLIELTREPSFESLRSDAKFRELVERIGWRA
ncbi:MAG TPA: winged helix-turn-helix domain-containing protein [Steroidobacteraceae bacterium]|nr:winged helix-turn-helix domain-containing protein [Steroidobacteraceae bacterium]